MANAYYDLKTAWLGPFKPYVGFGIGAGFTLDEFALWVHLQDVYWTDEGRASFDAVVIAVAFAALVVEGTTPFAVGTARWSGRRLAD